MPSKLKLVKSECLFNFFSSNLWSGNATGTGLQRYNSHVSSTSAKLAGLPSLCDMTCKLEAIQWRICRVCVKTAMSKCNELHNRPVPLLIHEIFLSTLCLARRAASFAAFEIPNAAWNMLSLWHFKIRMSAEHGATCSWDFWNSLSTIYLSTARARRTTVHCYLIEEKKTLNIY